MALLYTQTKIFHFRDKIDSLPKSVDEIASPIHIRIKPTNVCNHNCWYCAYRMDNQQLGKDMAIKDYIPREKMMEIIDDIVDMGVRSVTFSGGGEPFCYPYLLEVIKKLSRTRVKFACLTNGSLLKGELAQVFAHYGTWIRVSVDGWDGESYAGYRKVGKGEFTKIMNNIKKFKKLGGKCYLGIYLIIDRKNSSCIYEFIKRLKSIGVDSVRVSPCIVSNNEEENKRYHKPNFSRVIKAIEKANARLADERFQISSAYQTLDEKFKKEYTWCPYLQIRPVIGADLNVYACHDKAYNLDQGLIGSIRKSRFKDFWFRDKNKFFKIDPSLHCDHHCVVNTDNKLILDYLNADKKHLEFV